MKIIIFPLAILAIILSSCKNDPKVPADAATQVETPVITPSAFQEEMKKVTDMSGELNTSIKEMDALIGTLPKATAAKASAYLEDLQGMQEKTIMIEQEFQTMSTQVQAMSSAAANGTESQMDGATTDIKKAIDEMNVSRQSILETIKADVEAIKEIAGKKE
ncbi:MAG: hypothetical protein IPL65_04265 [Lewinellaceae bacterium]|nr:hypothetical protein [Lewinellaceae bacterium]